MKTGDSDSGGQVHNYVLLLLAYYNGRFLKIVFVYLACSDIRVHFAKIWWYFYSMCWTFNHCLMSTGGGCLWYWCQYADHWINWISRVLASVYHWITVLGVYDGGFTIDLVGYSNTLSISPKSLAACASINLCLCIASSGKQNGWQHTWATLWGFELGFYASKFPK